MFSFRPPPKPVRQGKEDGLAVDATRAAELETKKDNNLVFTTAYITEEDKIWHPQQQL